MKRVNILICKTCLLCVSGFLVLVRRTFKEQAKTNSNIAITAPNGVFQKLSYLRRRRRRRRRRGT
jgi:hypothetical protein